MMQCKGQVVPSGDSIARISPAARSCQAVAQGCCDDPHIQACEVSNNCVPGGFLVLAGVAHCANVVWPNLEESLEGHTVGLEYCDHPTKHNKRRAPNFSTAQFFFQYHKGKQ